jgi:hypothetical protein
MLHHNTETVLEIWRRRRGAALLPARSSFPDPALTPLLPQSLILGESERGLIVRLSGEAVGALLGADLKERSFAGLFRASDADRFAEMFGTARRASAPFVFAAREGRAGPNAVLLEFFLGPLASKPGGPRRWLGHVQALSPFAQGPLRGPLEAGAFALTAEARTHPPLRLVALNGARVA